MLENPEPLVRRAAIKLLAEAGDPKAANAIARLRTDADEAVRSAVVEALERLSKG